MFYYNFPFNLKNVYNRTFTFRPRPELGCLIGLRFTRVKPFTNTFWSQRFLQMFKKTLCVPLAFCRYNVCNGAWTQCKCVSYHLKSYTTLDCDEYKDKDLLTPQWSLPRYLSTDQTVGHTHARQEIISHIRNICFSSVFLMDHLKDPWFFPPL